MAAAQLAACVEGLDQWNQQTEIFKKLNGEKTQLIWIGTGYQLAMLTVIQLWQLITSVVEFDSTATFWLNVLILKINVKNCSLYTS